MADPATLAEAASCPVVTATPAVIAAEDATKSPSASKNGKKAESGSGGSGFFTWFMVLALLGVWTSVAVVYFDLVDYQGVLGKLVAYDTDGDGDFDVEDAKVLLDEKPGDGVRRGAKKEPPFPTRDAGLKLREALKQQLTMIHQRVEARKLARLALAEVRQLLAREEEEKHLELGRKDLTRDLSRDLSRDLTARVRDRVASRLKEEEEKIEREETEKELETLRKEKERREEEEEEEEEKEEEESKEGGEKKGKRGGEKEEKKVEGKKGKEAPNEEPEKGKDPGKERKKKNKADKSVKK